jgi:glutamyl-tRNA reductase
MSDHIPLGLIGISHKTAPVELREKVALSEEEQKAAVRQIIDQFDADGCLILSTCNRTEIYLSDNHLEESLEKVRNWLNELKQCSEYTDSNITYEMHDSAVAEHFFKVLSGLDSQIIGEQQITGQVKESYDLAHALNGTDTLINKLFNFAMQAKKRVHNETFLSDGTVSISFAGVELARKIFNNLGNKHVLLIGAGKTAELAAFHFQENGVKTINVVNRTYERALELAEKFGGTAYRMEQLQEALSESDIVISATSSTEYMVTEELLKPVVKKRNQRPIFLIDLAIPRDIDPAIDSINSVFLYNLDDLQEIVKVNLEKRKKEIPKSMKIIQESVDEFQQWARLNSMASVVGRLKKKLDLLRINELERLKAKLPQNGYRAEIENLTESIINKVVRQHVKSLKKVAHDPEQYSKQIEMIRHIYDLDNDN